MVKPGVAGVAKTTVSEQLTAPYLGSGGLKVYGTPAMIALMEAAAVAAIDPLLPEGQASVGVAINVKHLAATLPGKQVRARAEVEGVDGRKITFIIQAWDETELIGEGQHIRFIVESGRFMGRLETKG